MPILRNAKKALRASKRKAVFNRTVKSRTKTAIDAVKKTPTMATLSTAYSAIDKAVKRKVFHKNKAARLKQQLSKLVKPTKLAAKPAAKKPAKKAAKKKPAKK
jgi:ribosomal protein S20